MIAGGGTGGHVYPAIATIEALREKGDFEFLFVGGKNGMEMNIVPKYDVPLKSIWISGFQRYFTLRNILFPIKLLVSLIQSWLIARKFKPAAAVGTGGYVTGPILYAASKMGVPVLIQDQNVYPGITTRLLKKHARTICIAFEGAKKYLEDCLEKIVVTGNPVRKKLNVHSRAEAAKKWNLNPDKPVIFVFGGSQGARAINHALVKILPQFLETQDVQVLWQTGQKDFDTIKESEISKSNNVRIHPYIHEMDFAFSAADVIVSRAGAITLAELAVVQKPVILIPYPLAAGRHQEHNAKFIEDQGAALVIMEGPGWEAYLTGALEKLLRDQFLREIMAAAWQKLARPQAASQIAEEVIKLINKN